MDDEDQLVVPEAWRRAVHPRRGGIRPEPPVTGSEDRRRLPAAWDAVRERCEAILADPDTDPALVAAFRSGVESVTGAAVHAALCGYLLDDEVRVVLVSEWVADRGPAFAALALEESAGLVVGGNLALRDPTRRPFLRRLTVQVERGGPGFWPQTWTAMAARLRTHLALVEDDEHASVVAALAASRRGLARQRILATYLVPERQDWFDADIVLGEHPNVPREMLLFSAGTVERLGRFRGESLEACVTAVDAVGWAAAPLLARWYDDETASNAFLRACVDVLCRIPTDEALDLLLARIDGRHVGPGVLTSCELYPRRAARLLARRSGDWAVHLRERHLLGHPDVAGAERLIASRSHEAPPEAVPALLREPPWTRPRPATVVTTDALGAGPHETAMVWREGEREDWLALREHWGALESQDWTAMAADHRAGRLDPWQQVRLMAYGPAAVVRPLLPTWDSSTADTYLQSLRPLVADYGLDALVPVLRLARAKPRIGGPLLAPYLDAEIAWLMADWNDRSRSLRPIAGEWFERHGASGAALLLPGALGGDPGRRRLATRVLLRLDPDVVRAAADLAGLADHVEALLATDVLDLLPAKVPAPPRWMDPALLPQILLADGRGALPAAAVRALLSMVAISEPTRIYDGLRVVRVDCDPDSLSRFAWALFRQWELEGRPGSTAWAMDALGHLGGDAVVEQLAPLVRRWPAQGGAARAGRGVDALAGIGTVAALHELARLASSPGSAPVRAQAAAALDRVGLERGLLPEQLADHLVPDLDLPPDGLRFAYQEVDYVSAVDGDLRLVLRARRGAETATLPDPRSPEDRERSESWRSLRTSADNLLREQAARLETAMVQRRAWSPAELRTVLLAHPLLSEIARRVVWAHGSTAFAVVDGEPVGATGAPILLTGVVTIAHPALHDLGPWRGWLADLGGRQPFVQVGRVSFSDMTPGGVLGRTVATGSVQGLTRRGWVWAAREQGGLRTSLTRGLADGYAVRLRIEPGSHAGASIEPLQTLAGLEVLAADGQVVGFAALDPVARSEVLRDLDGLA